MIVNLVKERLLDLKAVLDYVDKIEQLDALVKQSQWFWFRKVIVATENKQLLRANGSSSYTSWVTETEEVVEEEENKYGTVAKLATQGTEAFSKCSLLRSFPEVSSNLGLLSVKKSKTEVPTTIVAMSGSTRHNQKIRITNSISKNFEWIL
ncbi:LOW QUALITY PROTEIN: hypothetical protein BRARA_J01730 [Brassica rapa]|uniref:Uncharacterized protein n=1 Tax=Brassica campestris TaxID=3711 RepID=A0A397XMV4_BRACM|nr:LOW QUALITY PROTEIN: hypothetical protein BRARA_J01730 [Brassica rapa]